MSYDRCCRMQYGISHFCHMGHAGHERHSTCVAGGGKGPIRVAGFSDAQPPQRQALGTTRVRTMPRPCGGGGGAWIPPPSSSPYKPSTQRLRPCPPTTPASSGGGCNSHPGLSTRPAGGPTTGAGRRCSPAATSFFEHLAGPCCPTLRVDPHPLGVRSPHPPPPGVRPPPPREGMSPSSASSSLASSSSSSSQQSS